LKVTLFNQDYETNNELLAKLTVEEASASDISIVLAGLFYMNIGEIDKAISILMKGTSKSSSVANIGSVATDFKFFRIYLAWCNVYNGKFNLALDSFDSVLNDNPKDLESMFGKVECLKRMHKYDLALETCNSIVASYSSNYPAKVTQMHLYMALQQWDQVVRLCLPSKTGSQSSLRGSARRSSLQVNNVLENDSIDFAGVLCLHDLAVVGKYEGASKKISDLFSIISRKEPQNTVLYLKYIRTFIRTCDRNDQILRLCEQKLFQLLEKDAEYAAECHAQLGGVYLMRNKIVEAKRSFQKALDLSRQCLPAIFGQITCMVMEKQYSEAEEQLEFFKENQEYSSFNYYLSALMVKSDSVDACVMTCNKAIDEHLSYMKHVYIE
jgi:tetratricopeptide (TPR) repeat protein